jgi:hypothetical protein
MLPGIELDFAIMFEVMFGVAKGNNLAAIVNIQRARENDVGG